MTLREKFIAVVDGDILKISDAIVLLEGDGLFRVNKAIELYKKGFAEKIIFSGNILNLEYGSYPFEYIKPMLQTAGIPENSILFENKSQNTYEQAVEVRKLVQLNGWTKILLVASHYHQYRAYLTFLKVWETDYKNIQIINSPENQLEWFKQTKWGNRFDILEEEFNKIDRYAAEGYLASMEFAINYQKWKEEQH